MGHLCAYKARPESSLGYVQVIFATRMQATSPVPLWQLYHKQESCHNTSTSFVFEHQMLVGDCAAL